MGYLKYFESKGTGLVVVSLGGGDLLLESIREVARQADIHTGVLATGIGSLTYAHIHTVVSNNNPPRDEHLYLQGPLEIVSFSGIIADYEPHIHISLMDPGRRFAGGHLEDGCTILTLAEISILRVSDLRLTRRTRDGSPIRLLDAE
jgi:predicted DNA-binding protein with PD1-like motif